MCARLLLPGPGPGDLDTAQLQTAVYDLCVHGFAIVESHIHARQLYTTARDRRLSVRLPQATSGGWRVELE